MKKMAIHTFLVRTICDFWPKFHTFWLPTYIGGLWGPPQILTDLDHWVCQTHEWLAWPLSCINSMAESSHPLSVINPMCVQIDGQDGNQVEKNSLSSEKGRPGRAWKNTDSFMIGKVQDEKLWVRDLVRDKSSHSSLRLWSGNQ
jgi:hypothetical protein